MFPTRFTAVVSLSAFLTAQAVAQDNKKFEPESHFPSDALLYFSLANAERFKEKCSSTLIGRMVSDPGWALAFRDLFKRLEPQLEEINAPFRAVTGKTPLELLRLLQGGVALVVRGPSPEGFPAEVALALEANDELSKVLERVGRFFEQQTGKKLEARTVGGVEATVWPLPGAPLFQARLGTHWLAVSSPGLLRDIASAYEGQDPGKQPFKKGSLHAELQGPLKVERQEMLLAVNLEAIRSVALAFLQGNPDAEEVHRVLQVTGLDRLTSLGLAIGFRDGGMEGAFHLGMRGGARGVLSAIQKALPALAENVDSALPLVPASAHEVQAARLAPGKMLRELDKLLRQNIPEVGEEMDGWFQAMKEHTGIDVEADLFALADITLVSFMVEPPAGGLLSDQVMVAQTEELKSYLSLLKKLAELTEATERELDATKGMKIRYVSLASGKTLATGGLLGAFFSGPGTPEQLASIPRTVLAAMVPVIAWVDLPEGWTVVSTLPQALKRYTTHYARGKRFSEVSELAALFRKQASGASAVSVFQGGKSILWAYNSLLSVGSAFAPFLNMLGVDLAPLPPAEAFEGTVRPGYMSLRMTPEGFTIRGHRALSSSSTVLAGAAVTGIVAGVVIPSLLFARTRALEVQERAMLRQEEARREMERLEREERQQQQERR